MVKCTTLTSVAAILLILLGIVLIGAFFLLKDGKFGARRAAPVVGFISMMIGIRFVKCDEDED